MFHVVLFEPEIPPNTGNIIRLCANSGIALHLVKPLGFSLRAKQLVRAGLDYHELALVKVHADWPACVESLGPQRLFALTTRGEQRYDTRRYQLGDVFVFGSETRGLPQWLLQQFPGENRIRLPMLPQSRSMNLSNAVAVVVYEAWRQSGFPGGA